MGLELEFGGWWRSIDQSGEQERRTQAKIESLGSASIDDEAGVLPTVLYVWSIPGMILVYVCVFINV